MKRGIGTEADEEEATLELKSSARVLLSAKLPNDTTLVFSLSLSHAYFLDLGKSLMLRGYDEETILPLTDLAVTRMLVKCPVKARHARSSPPGT